MKIATTLFLFVVVGFSVGDELGFSQSISNVEVAKRRSVSTRGNVPSYANSVTNRGDVRQQVQNTRQVVPPFKPLPSGAVRPIAQQPERQKLVVQQNNTALRTVPAPSLSVTQQDLLRQQQQQQQQQLIQQESKQKQQQKLQQEAFALQVLKQQRLQQQEAMRQQQLQKIQQQQKLQQQQLAAQQQLVAQQQKRHQQMQVKREQTPQILAVAAATPGKLPNIVAAIPPAGSIIDPESVSKPIVASGGLPPFISMPQSSAQLTDRISNSPTIVEDADNEVSKDDNQLPLPGDDVASSVNEMTLLSLHPTAVENSHSLHQQQTEKRQSLPSSLPSLAPIQGMETSLKALAEASNITLEALEAAILLRQQQLLRKQQGPTTSTTTTTTLPPPKNKYNSGATKVMNAPREYYPLGYDKNFDDNFASRVDLPDTSFYCGDQKHFPGLYADEDLGCMVFHVCALTDDGLIMKSFLCPESTLFDQTILKCNWWFYVDCKSSKSLYDSNIPISKSYQLMKALAFFSAYKNHDNSTTNAQDSLDPNSS
ncbi:mind the gap isoform X2 [Megalopta genalis]|uniref:mind the gap isoform X2 n=1 Tax=Megalopta genalis TaxID=115081 RepID=UPI003FD43FCC